MVRPPLPADQRRSRYVALRLTEAEVAPVQAIADTEYGGNLSVAIRVLLSEAVPARAGCDTCREYGWPCAPAIAAADAVLEAAHIVVPRSPVAVSTSVDGMSPAEWGDGAATNESPRAPSAAPTSRVTATVTPSPEAWPDIAHMSREELAREVAALRHTLNVQRDEVAEMDRVMPQQDETQERDDDLEDEHGAAWQSLTDNERALLLAAKGRGGVILDNPDWAPDCGRLVELGLVGKHEAALTPAGHALANWGHGELVR